MSFDNPTPPEEPTVPSGDATPPPPPPPPPAPPVPPAGATPPPPPPPGHASPAGDPVSGSWSVGSAYSYSWAKFQQYLSPILVSMLILFVAALIVGGIWFVIVGALQNAVFGTIHVSIDPNTGVVATTGGPSFLGGLLFQAIGTLVYATVAGFVMAAITRAALAITEGKPIETSTILSTDRLGEVILAAFLYGVLMAIGSFFCGIGALFVEFFLFFMWYFLLDKGMSAVDSIKASFDFVKERLGEVFLFILASIGVYIVGLILCGVGLIVAIPLIIIATAYTYKKLTGQAVAA